MEKAKFYDVYIVLRYKDGRLYYRFWQSNWWGKNNAEIWTLMDAQKRRLQSYRNSNPDLKVNYEITERK